MKIEISCNNRLGDFRREIVMAWKKYLAIRKVVHKPGSFLNKLARGKPYEKG
jgi:hypothetical protein